MTRSYEMEWNTDTTAKLCTEGLISNPSLHAIVNPNTDRAEIYFDKEQLTTYCKECCPEAENCTNEIKKNIIILFNPFSPHSIE